MSKFLRFKSTYLEKKKGIIRKQINNFHKTFLIKFNNSQNISYKMILSVLLSEEAALIAKMLAASIHRLHCMDHSENFYASKTQRCTLITSYPVFFIKSRRTKTPWLFQCQFLEPASK